MANPSAFPTSLKHTDSGVSIASTTSSSSTSSTPSSHSDDLFPCSFPSPPIPTADSTATSSAAVSSQYCACPPFAQLAQGLSLDSDLEITDEFALAMAFNDSSNESDSDLDGLLSAHSTPQSTPKPPQIDEDDIESKLSHETETAAESADIDDIDIGERVHVVEQQHRTLIIFDWDDTLHPTSLLKKRAKLSLSAVRTFGLKLYETLLSLIRLYGAQNIFIVSNADKSWIEQCLVSLSGGYFVNVYHLISLYDIEIISAKNRFSGLYPNEAVLWKQKAIACLVQQFAHEEQLAVVCIGDSVHEYIASERVVARLNRGKSGKARTVLHRVKLLQRPTLTQLTEQFELIQMIAHLFGEQTDAIDIDYEREMRHFESQSQSESV